MAGRAAYQRPESDSEIFFASIFGAALVLLLNELLCSVVFRSGDGELGPSLLSRAVPVTSVRLLYTLFVLLPAFVAFTAIGLPFFLRTLRAGLRGRLSSRSKRGLFVAAIGVAVAAVEVHFGRNGSTGVALLFVVGLIIGFPRIAGVGRAHGFRLLTASALALAGLAWCESRLLEGVAPEIALAPSMLVAAGFFAATGLLTATAAVMQHGREGLLRMLACWLASLTWVGAPLLRSRLTDTPALADRMEVAVLAGAAAVLTAASLLRRTPREYRS